jgi:hypothetical protein
MYDDEPIKCEEIGAQTEIETERGGNAKKSKARE